ncbi:MAG: CHAP domain-containing protein [Candidatus Uhrbacteria bacterium]|nr:CHAP domain-containing protein [Candidatus Uhrbacteria bacterium]
MLVTAGLIVIFSLACSIGTSNDARNDNWSLSAPSYGEALGEFEGVTMYSSNGENVRGKYGLEFQCVEYVNRFYVERLGFPNLTKTGDADSYYWNAEEKGLRAYQNGGETPPEQYDILVFDGSPEDGSPGHIAIVTGVDLETGTVSIVQQNIHARRFYVLHKYVSYDQLDLMERNGTWFVDQEPYNHPVAGWSRPIAPKETQ